MRIFKFLLVILLLSFNLVSGQKLQASDSIHACQVTSAFFDWYVGAIKGTIKTDYQPEFVQAKNGMTTLDFREYLDNLKRLHCTADFIQKERDAYNDCLYHLSKIEFKDFKSGFTDLDQYEAINCDFGNYYRWIGGQEPIDGIKIERVDRINAETLLVTVTYFVDNGKGYRVSYWGGNRLSLVKQNGTWLINAIGWSE